MKRTKKIFVGFLVCLSVLSGSLGLAACGETDGSQGLEYSLLANGTYEVSGIGECTDTSIVIPSKYNGKKVTSIGNSAFAYCEGLTNITIPDSVTSIGDAFYSCDSLKSVEIPDSVTSIGDYAFSHCESLVCEVKDNLKYLWNEKNPYLYLIGVADTSITSATIENTCKFIGRSAFDNCSSLTSITIPDSVTSIGGAAFSRCDNLEYNVKNNLKYLGNEKNPYLYLAGVNTSLTTATIENSCKFIGFFAFEGCDALKNVSIPDSVISIGEGAFSYHSELTSVVIPNSVKRIYAGAFYGCESLTSVVIGKGVTFIGESAFSDCESLNSITFNGKKAQWVAISKHYVWISDAPATKVVCSDGEMAI